MRETANNRAGRRPAQGLNGWLLIGALGVLGCAAALPARASAAPGEAACATATIWVTQPLPAGGLGSTWETPDCASAGAHAADTVITLEPTLRKQRVLGFGAALTGSAAWLMTARLSKTQRTRLVRSLFAPAPRGIGLSLLRLPIGSTDLSRRRYSLAPTAPATDTDPVHLDLRPLRQTTLPVLRAILKTNPDLRIIASPWSPPAWMKTSGSLMGGQLPPARETQFAQYVAGFVDAMGAAGIPIFAVTLQNEPGYVPADYPGLRMDAPQRARIVANALGPLLARAHPETTILEWDDNWDRFKQPLEVLADAGAAPHIGGVAWHCYIGRPHVQDLVHARHPDKWQLVTECSDGTWSPNSRESLADFTDRVLIEPMRHWGAGTILWSLALDEQHGPHTGGCGRCIGVVTITRDGRAEPTRDYYALGHFSAFVTPGSYRIESHSADDTLRNVGFLSADGRSVTLVLANRGKTDQRAGVALDAHAPMIFVSVPAGGLATLRFSITPQAPQSDTPVSAAVNHETNK